MKAAFLICFGLACISSVYSTIYPRDKKMAMLYFSLITAAFFALGYLVYDNHLAHGGTTESFFTGTLCVDGLTQCGNYPLVDLILFKVLVIYRYIVTLLLLMATYFIFFPKKETSLVDRCVMFLAVIFMLFIFWSW